MRKIIVALVCALMLAGCADKAAVPPESYAQALAMIAEENGVYLSSDEVKSAREMAEVDFPLLIELGEEVGSAEELERAYMRELLEKKLRDTLFADITATGQEVEQWYEARASALARAIESEPGVFKNQQESYELYGGVPPLIVPEGYRRFKHILVSDEETARQILGMLDAGGDFEKLLADYGTDGGMAEEPYRTLGYLTGPYPSANDYLSELKEQALSLEEPGDYGGVISSPAGYHIVMLTEKLEARTLSLDEAANSIGLLLTNYKRQTALEEMIDRRMTE